MPLSTITSARSATHTAEGPDGPTSEESASGRVRFADELGRETASIAPEFEHAEVDGQPDRATSRVAVDATKRNADRDAERARRATPAERDDLDADADADTDAEALALLVAVLPPPTTPVVVTLPPGDPLASQITANSAVATLDAAVAVAPPLLPGESPATLFDEVSVTQLSRAAIAAAVDATDAIDAANAAESADSTHSMAAVDGVESLATAIAHGAAAERTAEVATGFSTRATSPPQSDPTERITSLAELPRLLRAEIDGFLRLGRHGEHWEAELRLDPPELGALHIRFELVGHHLHGHFRCEDARLEPVLEELFNEWEAAQREQGGGASFDLSRGAKEEEGRTRIASRAEPPLGAVAVVPRTARGAGPDGSRIVDLLA